MAIMSNAVSLETLLSEKNYMICHPITSFRTGLIELRENWKLIVSSRSRKLIYQGDTNDQPNKETLIRTQLEIMMFVIVMRVAILWSWTRASIRSIGMAHATDIMTAFVEAMKHQGKRHACNTRLRFVWERNGRIIGVWCSNCRSILPAPQEISGSNKTQTSSRSRRKHHHV